MMCFFPVLVSRRGFLRVATCLIKGQTRLFHDDFQMFSTDDVCAVPYWVLQRIAG